MPVYIRVKFTNKVSPGMTAVIIHVAVKTDRKDFTDVYLSKKLCFKNARLIVHKVFILFFFFFLVPSQIVETCHIKIIILDIKNMNEDCEKKMKIK